MLREIAAGMHIVQVASLIRAALCQWYPMVEVWRAFNRFTTSPTDETAFAVGLGSADSRKVGGGEHAATVCFADATAMIARIPGGPSSGSANVILIVFAHVRVAVFPVRFLPPAVVFTVAFEIILSAFPLVLTLAFDVRHIILTVVFAQVFMSFCSVFAYTRLALRVQPITLVTVCSELCTWLIFTALRTTLQCFACDA